MERYRVVIATTAGPSFVKGLSEEDPSVHSVVCLDDTEQDLPISPAYHRFVRDPTGVIERHFGKPTWRMDVTHRIDAGNSWKLGIFVAHALHAAGRLAPANDDSAAILWLTGDVTRSLSVRPVGEVSRKLQASGDLFSEAQRNRASVSLFVPTEDVIDAGDNHLIGVSSVTEVLETIGLPLRREIPEQNLPDNQPGAGLDFTDLIREKRWNFTGRDWLLDEIKGWIDQATDESVLLLVGDPGAGKSALIAQMSSDAIAHQFCQADARITLDGGRFVRSIAAQIGHASAEFAGTAERPEVAEFLTAESCQIDPSAAMDFGLIRAFEGLPQSDERSVILVDGLDESLAAGGRQTISELLGSRAKRFPRSIVIVATTRPDQRVLSHFEGVRVLRLDALDDRNLKDLHSFVGLKLPRTTVDRVCEWSGGNFLYARQVVESIERGDDILEGGGEMPRGLDSLYSRFFNRYWPNGAGFAPARQILSIMIAARQPLSAGQVRSALQSSNQRLDHSALDALGPFLRADGKKLEVFHSSIVDWLTGPDARAGPFSSYRIEGEKILAAWCGNWAADLDDYQLTHASSHMRALRDIEGLMALIADPAFVAIKSRRPNLEYSLRDDEAELMSALLDAGRDGEAIDLVLSGGAASGAILAASTVRLVEESRLIRLASSLIDTDAPDRGRRLNAATSGLAIAAQHGFSDLILRLVRDPEPAVRSAVAATIYLIWRRDANAGWKLVEQIGSKLFSAIGFPNLRVLDVLGGVTLALVGGHLDDQDAMVRLHRYWKAWVSGALRRPAARIAGRKWATALAVPSLRLLLNRQPDHQPLNLAEIDHAVTLHDAHHDVREIAIAAIEEPQQNITALVDVLCTAEFDFDVILMLAAERALILAGKSAPSQTFDLLERLENQGNKWLRQSVLYSGFHIARQEDSNASLVDRYLVLSARILIDDRALFQTFRGTYQMTPHIAWAEVLARNEGLRAEGVAGRLLEQALVTNDAGLLQRIVGAAEVLSLGYSRHRAALDLLGPIVRSQTESTIDSLTQTLANIRFRANDEVDTFLRDIGADRLRRQVGLTLPSVGAADFPTWMDDMFIGLLLKRPQFRAQIAHAFRDAAQKKRTSSLLASIVPWVAELVVESRD